MMFYLMTYRDISNFVMGGVGECIPESVFKGKAILRVMLRARSIGYCMVLNFEPSVKMQ